MTYTTEEKTEIANTIIEQMGGFGRLQAMTNASGFSSLTGSDLGISFHFKGSRKANICQITLLPSDTYKFELFKFSRKTLDCPVIYEVEGVYDYMLRQIFEKRDWALFDTLRKDEK